MADFNRHLTANAACAAVMKTVGLTPPTSFAGSTDKTAAQFWTLATEVGQQLMDMHKWQILNNTFTITILDGVNLYDLPEDFNGFVNDSEWNTSSHLPAVGSLEEFEWQRVSALGLTGVSLALLFRVKDDQVEFMGLPAAGQEIVMPYNSRGWVRSATGGAKDTLTSDDDIVMLESNLFKVALRRMWMDVKQFDTTKIEREYMRALIYAKGKDKPGRTLYLVRPCGCDTGFGLNIPITGLGGGTGGGSSSLPPSLGVYDIAASLEGVPTAHQEILPDMPVARALYFASNFAFSRGELVVAPTAPAVFTISRDGVTVGTCTFAAGSLVGVFATTAGPENTYFNAGDQLRITAPAVADATLSGPGFTLVATLL